MVLVAITSGACWLTVAGAGGATTAQAAAPAMVPIAAAVAPDGTPATPSNGTWATRKVDVGRYQLVFEHGVALAVSSWELPAGVTVQPLPDHMWLVTFAADDVRVDTGFTFRAAPLP